MQSNKEIQEIEIKVKDNYELLRKKIKKLEKQKAELEEELEEK